MAQPPKKNSGASDHNSGSQPPESKPSLVPSVADHTKQAARAAEAAARARAAAQAGQARAQQVAVHGQARPTTAGHPHARNTESRSVARNHGPVRRALSLITARRARVNRSSQARLAGDPPVSDTELKPVARAYWRMRHVLILLSFLIVVAAPSALSGFYLYTIAADQYASKVGFTVRREDASSSFEILGGLTSLSNSSSSDTDILYEFIQSQKLVSDIDEDFDLRAMWSKPVADVDDLSDWQSLISERSADVIFALAPDASLEELVHYWNRMVRISYEAGSGLIELEVLAFSPEDATAISQALFEESSQMINNLSDVARQDAIRYARQDLDETLERLRDARAIVTRFRNIHQIVDPEIDIQTQAGLIGNLQTQQAQTLIEIDLLQDGNINASDPRLVQAFRRIKVIENRIKAERQKSGIGEQSNGNTFADLLGDYERLIVDREFAEKSYITALANYDASLADARRQTRYLAAYMQPTIAETPEYPKRFTILALITLFLFLIWSVVILVFSAISDRR